MKKTHHSPDEWKAFKAYRDALNKQQGINPIITEITAYPEIDGREPNYEGYLVTYPDAHTGKKILTIRNGDILIIDFDLPDNAEIDEPIRLLIDMNPFVFHWIDLTGPCRIAFQIENLRRYVDNNDKEEEHFIFVRDSLTAGGNLFVCIPYKIID